MKIINQKFTKRDKLVYFGNKTSGFQKSKSTLETLEPLMAEIVDIKTYSHKKSKLLRLLDMLKGFFSCGLRADIIFIDVYSTMAFLYAEILGFMSRLFQKKYVLILHGGNLPYVYRKRKNRFKILFKGANYIVAPSHYLKNYFEGVGFSIQMIPNIIELKQYPYLERNKVRGRILGLRGFKSAYNPLMTLRAVNILSKRNIFVELTLLGNRDEEHYWEVLDYIKNNSLEDQITVLPKLEKSEWIEASRNFDIMVSNPLIDNTPVSIIEGMALGMCVITTKVGGVPDLVKDYQQVLFVESKDSENLADKISELIMDSELAHSLSKSGRKKAEQFDWNAVKPLWKNLLYKEV